MFFITLNGIYKKVRTQFKILRNNCLKIADIIPQIEKKNVFSVQNSQQLVIHDILNSKTPGELIRRICLLLSHSVDDIETCNEILFKTVTTLSLHCFQNSHKTFLF